MSKSKYSKELLEPLVKASYSVSDVLRFLGISTSGNIHQIISDKIIKYDLDTSHFRSPRAGKKLDNKLSPEQILVLDRNNGRRDNIKIIRRALIESGFEEICEQCGLIPFWNDKPLTLQVDHKDGNCLNNNIENLRFICPNCHAQTENYGGKNITPIMPTRHKCLGCDKIISIRSDRCRSCSNIKMAKELKNKNTKISWPTIDNLLLMVKELGFLSSGRLLGVSDNAIRKRIKNYS